jgi:HEAT repeat protein
MRLALAASILALAFAPACASRAKASVSLYESGDYAGAARAADQGLASHPDDSGLWQMRVRAALALGDREAVARSYDSYRGHREDDDAGLLRDLAIATIGQALASPSVKLKIAAIEVVASAELQDLADQVAERMGDDDDRVAAAAAVAVLRGFPQAPQVASQMLRSDDPEARRIALEGVAKKVGAPALADLEKLAGSDPDPRVRRAAIRWLGQLKDKEAVELLARQLRHPDESVRAAAATALARIGIGNLADFASKALADRALAVRLAAIDLLVAAKRTDELVKLADDPDPLVAAEAATAAHRPELAGKALDRAATAEAWTTRAGALNIAGRAIGKPAALALAHRLLADPEVGVRLAAARVLAHGGERAAAIQVFAALVEPAGETALTAAGELASLGDERGTKLLDAMVRDPAATPDQRAAAAAAHRSARVVTPGLVAALADPSGVVRVEAATAIILIAKRD